MSVPPPPPPCVPRWTLGDRLRKAREHGEFTQAGLAAEMGISRAAIVSYETGRTLPSRPILLSWSIATGVPLEWLTEEDEDEPEDGPEFRKGRILTLPATA
jgi:transcriptional regulator with XRE-family HTH domain